jgi:hypothetical protein
MNEFHPNFNSIHNKIAIIHVDDFRLIFRVFRACCMDRDLFLPISWEELKWWVNTGKRLVNDVSGGRLCIAQSVVIKVEGHLEGRTSQPFELTPDLCGWVTCEFRYHVELALIEFATAQKNKAYAKWLKVKKRR